MGAGRLRRRADFSYRVSFNRLEGCELRTLRPHLLCGARADANRLGAAAWDCRGADDCRRELGGDYPGKLKTLAGVFFDFQRGLSPAGPDCQ